MSFSPCGNFLLYVTAPMGGGDSPGASRGPPGSSGASSTAEDAALKGPPECFRQEVGIVDFFGDESLTTCVPLRGGTVCEELPSVLQAFWSPSPPTSGTEANTLVVVITQRNVELFKVGRH